MLPKQEELASVWLVKISACGRPFCVLSDSLHDGCKFCDNNECHTEFCLPCITAFALHQTLVSTGLACLHVFEKCWNYGSMNFSFLHFWQNLWLRDWFVKWICFFFLGAECRPQRSKIVFPLCPGGDCCPWSCRGCLPSSVSRWWLPFSKLPKSSPTFRPGGCDCRPPSYQSSFPLLPRWRLPPSKLPKSSRSSAQVVVAAFEGTKVVFHLLPRWWLPPLKFTKLQTIAKRPGLCSEKLRTMKNRFWESYR